MRLVRKAYPSLSPEMKDKFAMDAFMDALNDSDLEWSVYQGHPKSLHDASKLAHEYEAFRMGRGKRSLQGGKIRFQRTEKGNTNDLTSYKDVHESLLKEIKLLLKPTETRPTEARPNRPNRPIAPNCSPTAPKTLNSSESLNKTKKPFQYGKCHFCKRDGHWMDECRKMKHDFPDDQVRNQIKQVIKTSLYNKEPQHSLSQLTLSTDKPQESTKCTSSEQVLIDSDQSETLMPLPDVTGTIAGTVEQLQNESPKAPASNPFNESLYLPININGIHVNSLIDSGSTLTVLHPDTYHQIPLASRPSINGDIVKLRMADGSIISSLGEVDVKISIKGQSFEHTATLADVESSAVLGYDFLKKHGCCLDFGESTLCVNGIPISCIRLNQLYDNLHITVKEAVTLEPHSESIIEAEIVHPKTASSLPETVLVKPVSTFQHFEGMLMAKIVLDPRQQNVPLRLANFGNKTMKLQKNTLVATGEPVEVINIGTEFSLCQAKQKETLTQQTLSDTQACADYGIPPHFSDLWNEFFPTLNDDQKIQSSALLRDVQHVFSKDKNDLGQTNLVKHRINTGESRPIKQPARRLPLAKRTEAEAEVSKMLERGIITPTTSPWSSPIVLIRKKDGSIRFCIDYRQLNNKTIKGSYPLPPIDNSLDALGQA